MNGHVLGLDLSLTETGWATLGPDGHECGVIRTTPAQGDLVVRLDEICSMALRHAEQSRLVVIEQPYNAAFGIEPAKVYGAVVYALYSGNRTGHRMVTVPPSSVKVFACGQGSTRGGSKIGPAISAAQRLGYDGANDNEVDALWLAALGWHLLGSPVVNLPATHTRALSASWAKGWPGYVAPIPKARKKKAA